MTAPATYVDDSMDMLRFSTAGSVDDGKSTLIGRLLYETKSIFADQLSEVERVSRRDGAGELNLALLTDGLRAEREQGITIDVAYRYFATPRRKFIVADTPGHAQYTRNMVTGTSTADAAVVLVDAVRGLTEQSRRHLYVAALVRVPHVVICVNKMDLAGYDRAVFERFRAEIMAYAAGLDLPDLTFIPISAMAGDNVAGRGERMPWYEGPALLPWLEEVPRPLPDAGLAVGARFPVQLVSRPRIGAAEIVRGYAGQVAAGVFRPGDEVVVLPAGVHTRIRSIETFDGPLHEAFPPLSVALMLADEIDISRGDLIASAGSPPEVSREIEATLCWMSTTPMRPGGRYAIKHTTRSARAIVKVLHHRVDVNTLAEGPAEALMLNDIGRVSLKTTMPLVFDPYSKSRATGSFILIDQMTNETVAAGMIAGRTPAEAGEETL
jgi:bifunctional enzyme CysN/CysC